MSYVSFIRDHQLYLDHSILRAFVREREFFLLIEPFRHRVVLISAKLPEYIVLGSFDGGRG